MVRGRRGGAHYLLGGEDGVGGWRAGGAAVGHALEVGVEGQAGGWVVELGLELGEGVGVVDVGGAPVVGQHGHDGGAPERAALGPGLRGAGRHDLEGAVVACALERVDDRGVRELAAAACGGGGI